MELRDSMTSISHPQELEAKARLGHPKYRPDIDGMRAIAVLSVVLFHAFPSYIKGGFVGVDVFFVISGFLISSIIFGGLERKSFSFGEFYSRRVNRIFPALLIVLFASWAFGWFALFADEFMQLGKHIAGGSVFVSNLVLLSESGYFDNSAETKILLHLWSLGIEEQFYLLWPLILWAAWKARLNALILIVVVAAISFWLNVSNIKTDSVSVFYSPQTRFWELLAGSFLAYVTMNKDVLLPTWRATASPVIRNCQSFAGMAMLFVAFSLVTKNNAFPGWWALLPTIGSVMIIAAGPHAWLNRSILSHRILVFIGLISFPLYLWHWPLLTFARIIESGTPSAEIRLAAVALSVLLAWMTYRFIEIPLRNIGSRTRTIALTILMIGMGITGYVTYKFNGLPDRGAVKFSEKVNAQFVGPLWQYTKNDSCMAKHPMAGTADFGWWFCMESEDANPTLMLIGTSFANHLYAGLAQNPETKQNTILSIGTCDPANPDTAPEGTPVTTHPCSGDRPLQQKNLINDIIDKSKTVKYAIIDGLNPQPDAAYAARLGTYIGQLEEKGVGVIVFIPHLMLGYDAKGCFARPFKSPINDCTISHEQREGIDKAYAPIIAEITKAHPDVRFFDQNQMLCKDEKCTGIQDGMPLYRDEYGHYSEFGSVELAKIFAKWAKDNAPGLLAQ
jgi:peptidoglycan/LPS O-acetylase OafA/YrhL